MKADNVRQRLTLTTKDLKTGKPVIIAELVGPIRFNLTCDATTYKLSCQPESSAFPAEANIKGPKIYIFSSGGKPIYVGATVSRMRERLRSGWNANGKNGYHGYPFRHELTNADLNVWYMLKHIGDASEEMETIEAEVVFLIRCAGQWPRYQTEIHFHRSEEYHRSLAAHIAAHYGIPGSHPEPAG